MNDRYWPTQLPPPLAGGSQSLDFATINNTFASGEIGVYRQLHEPRHTSTVQLLLTTTQQFEFEAFYTSTRSWFIIPFATVDQWAICRFIKDYKINRINNMYLNIDTEVQINNLTYSQNLKKIT